jgi:hypothetical protein
VEKYGTVREVTDSNIIERMAITCWIKGYKHTLRICNTYRSSTATMVTRTRLTVTLYVQYSTVLYSTVQYSTVQYSTVQYITLPVLFPSYFAIEAYFFRYATNICN